MSLKNHTVHIGHEFVFFFDNALCLSGGPDDEDEHGEQDEEAAGQVVRSPSALVLKKGGSLEYQAMEIF